MISPQTKANAEYIASVLSQTRPAKYKAFVFLFDEYTENKVERLKEELGEIIRVGGYLGTRLDVIVRPGENYQSIFGVVVATGQDEYIDPKEVYESMFSSIYKITSDAGLAKETLPEPVFVEGACTEIFADFVTTDSTPFDLPAFYANYVANTETKTA